MDEQTEPAKIDIDKSENVTVTFVDGYVARFDLLTLRQACPCAACRSLRDRGELAYPSPDSPAPLRIDDARVHGAWGLNLTWNDGHSTGIFPFDALRRWHEGESTSRSN